MKKLKDKIEKFAKSLLLKYKSYSKRKKALNTILSILFSIYFIFALFARNELLLKKIFVNYALIGVLLFILLFLIFNILFLVFDNLNFKKINGDYKKVSKKEILFYFIVVLLVLLVYFIAYYPAGMTPDSYSQWMQVQNSSYSDWHPIMHTLIFFKIPTLIWNNPASCVIFQILFISSIIAYCCYSLRSLGIPKKWIIAFLILFLIHPSNGIMAITLWKDIPYSYCILLMTILLMWIYRTKGEWIKNIKNLIFFSLTSLGVLFFRHNGILVFVPVMLMLILFYKKYRKRFLILFILILGTKFIVSGPIYNLLGFSSHSAGFREAMGVPSNQISTIYNKGGDVSDEELAVMSKIAPLWVWENYYDQESFNMIKNTSYYSETYIQENKTEFLKTWVSMVIRNPYLALNSYYNVTKCIWGFNSNNIMGSPHMIGRSELLKYDTGSPIPVVKKIVDKYNIAFRSTFVNNIVAPGIGLSLFLMIFSTVIVLFKEKKKILIITPIMMNTLAIMMLITGGELRFVYANIIVFIPLILFQFFVKEDKNEKLV